MQIELRKVEEGDHAFIYATYIRNRWFDNTNKTTLKRSTWSTMQHKRLEAILAKGAVLVACLSEDKEVILGYSLIDGAKPYTYIKLAFRSPEFRIKDKLMKGIITNEAL